jgi:predicted nuclease of predicted toxin-antitoxin system
MRFLVDAQLPPALARWIASQSGHEAEHVAFALSPSATDEAIVAYAVAEADVIVTKDADFLNLAPPPQLLIVATGNIPNKALLAVFEERFATVVEQLAGGRTVVEIG